MEWAFSTGGRKSPKKAFFGFFVEVSCSLAIVEIDIEGLEIEIGKDLNGEIAFPLIIDHRDVVAFEVESDLLPFPAIVAARRSLEVDGLAVLIGIMRGNQLARGLHPITLKESVVVGKSDGALSEVDG